MPLWTALAGRILFAILAAPADRGAGTAAAPGSGTRARRALAGGRCGDVDADGEDSVLSFAVADLGWLAFTIFVHLSAREGCFLFCELRRGASELHLELEPPVPRLLRAASHAGAALWLVGDVDDSVLRYALSDLGWSSRVRGGRG